MNKAVKVEKVVLNQLYSDIHKPKSTDGFPLYTKLANSIESEGDMVRAEKSEQYMKQCQTNYNSPTNIQTLYITKNCIKAQLYKGYVKNNVPGQQTHTSESFKDISSLIRANVEAIQKQQQNIMSEAIGMKGADITTYNITGNVLGIIANPYTMNNLEELYMDWSIFTSDEIMRWFPEFCQPEVLWQFANGAVPQSGVTQTDKFGEMIQFYASGGTKDIRKRFPRLRMIAMISNLDSTMIERLQTNKTGILYGFGGISFDNDGKLTEASTKKLNDVRMTDFERLQQMGILGNGNLVIYQDLSSDLDKINLNFIIKSSMYKFDNDVLAPAVEKLKRDFNDINRKLKYGTGTSANNENSTDELGGQVGFQLSPIEQRLEEIKQENGDIGENIVKNILRYVSRSGYKKSELEAISNQFSKPNRENYKSYLGLQ